MSGVDRQGTIESPRAPPKHLRAVGRLEWFLFARTKVQADSCLLVAAKYVPAHSGDVINKASLYPALGEVVRTNVALASRIAPASGRRRPPEWVRLSSLDLDRVVEFIDDDSSNLESIFEAQFQRGFDPDTDLPLWRLAVLRDATLIFAFDHALCDGLSGLAFHRLLLAALQENRTCLTSVFFADDKQLPPALEEATRISIPWCTVFRETLKLFNPLAWRRYLATWAGNRIPPSFELDMRVHILTYAPDEAQRLLALSRAQGATLTATVHTLCLLTLSRMLDRHEHGRFRFTTTYVPISLRGATGALPDAFCNHYSSQFSEHKLFSGPVLLEEAEFPWDHAARFTRELKAAAPHAASTMGLLKLVGTPGKSGKILRRPLGHRRMIGIELSNLGSFSRGPGVPGEQEQEIAGRRAVEIVPTPAVAVAEAIKSQDASRGAGDASAAADGHAETTEIASPAANRGEIENADTDTAHVVGNSGPGGRPVAPPALQSASVPESPVPVAETLTETQGGGEAITSVRLPVEGDKETSPSAHPRDGAATPHLTSTRTSTSASTPGGPPTGSTIDVDALNEHERERRIRSPSPSPHPAGKTAFPAPEPPLAKDVVDGSQGAPGAHHTNHTMPAKEAQWQDAPPHSPAVPMEPHARARSSSESDRAVDRLHPHAPAPRTKPEPAPELVSPHAHARPVGWDQTDAGEGRADPPHPTPTPTAAAADAKFPAPTGHARDAVANSAAAPAAGGCDNAGGGQPGPVGNGFPTLARAQEPLPTQHGAQPEPVQPDRPERTEPTSDPTTTAQEPLWAMREVLFAQGDGTLGAALKVCVAGTPAGGLGVVIGWGRSAVDEEFGKEFVVGFADGVRALTAGGGGGGGGGDEPVNGDR